MNPNTNRYPFPYPPQNPNPTPNFFFPSVPQPPPPPPQIPPPAAPILDLSTALSSLTDLLSLSQQTLYSLSSLLSPQSNSVKPRNANFISCLYNPHHLMPAESLFLHSLRCPSSLFEDPDSLFDTLHYPKTLTLQNPSKNLFVQSSQDSDAELCLSLDCYYDEFSSNFFYQGCPGVVNFKDLDNADKSFILPNVLSVECSNFVGSNEGDFKGFDKDEFRILPSDLWAIRKEVEGWVDYPSFYSYSVFCAILQFSAIKLSDLRMWIIANSPHYGVVIDVYMRDHISMLFGLCLKAIRREALSFLHHGMDKKNSSFNCPVQNQALTWIVSQLSVLYGEMNAKCFAIHIFRQCILEVANGLFFPLESNSKETSKVLDANGNDVRDIKLQEHLEGSLECKVGIEEAGIVDRVVIFVSQVAASVAALHERSLLEATIKKLRVSQPIPRYQRIVEHAYISKGADEVRNKHPNYRAIIDHDGLPRKQSSNQESNKTKTREELLAEERDYKRRRMSYRGKKLKRSTLQVMRDIIGEFMEEIKQAGGIGCFEKGAEEEERSPKPLFSSDVVDEPGKSIGKSSEAIRVVPNNFQKQSHSEFTTSNNASYQDYSQQIWGNRRNHVEYHRSISRDRHGRDHYSGSPERRRSHGSMHDYSSRRRDRDVSESIIAKHHERRSSSKPNYQSYKSSYSVSDSASNSSVQKDENLELRHGDLRNSYGNHNSKILENNAFEDRYDPADSQDTCEDDVYTCNK